MQLAKRHPFACLWALLFCSLLVSCAAPEHPTASVVQAATPPAPESTLTDYLTFTPPGEATPRATSLSMDDGGSASLLQPELTATTAATLPTPTLPASTVTPIPTSTEVDGWLIYENDFLGYRFSYPPEATISHHGTNVEPPENITSNVEYLAWLKTVYPNDLCTGVGYKTGFVVIHPEDETLSLYASPCGITGIGDQRIEQWQEAVTIDGEPYMASAYRLYNRQTDQFESEFFLVLHIDDRLRIDFGSRMQGAPRSAQQNLSEAEINEVRETLRRIVDSFRLQ